MSVEFRGQRYARPDILHNEDSDLIVNRSLDTPQTAQALLSVAREGIPSTWTAYLPYSGWVAGDKAGSPPDLFVDSLNQPQYFAKIRENTHWIDRKDPYRSQQQRLIDHAMASVLNEIHLSPVVRDLLRTAEATKLVRRYGFKRFDFIEPLVARIDRITRQKICFYPFVKGNTVLADNYHPLTDITNRREKKFSTDITNLFKTIGIYPGDFGIFQTIAPDASDPNFGTLYVIDIEGYCCLV